MTKKEKFLQYLDKQKEEDWDYFSVTVKTRGSIGTELIVNPMCNYETKRAYYDNAYNDDLVLKSFDGISIVGYEAFCNGCKIEEYFFDEDFHNLEEEN